MKRFILIVFVVIPFIAIAQKRKPLDSLDYYNGEMVKLRQRTFDSLRNSDRYQNLVDNIERLQSLRNERTGIVFGAELLHSDVTAFNRSIADSGFPAMQSMMPRFTFGMSYRKDRRIFEFLFFTAGVKARSKKEDEKIKMSVSNLLQFRFGYDLFNNNAFSLYPYGGISLRLYEMEYEKPAVFNPQYTNITNLISNKRATIGNGGTLGYELGMGADIRLNQKSGTYLYLNGGLSGGVGKQRFDVDGFKYDPGINKGNWYVGIGFKFMDNGTHQYR